MKTRIQSQNFGTERAVRFQMLNKVYIYPTHMHQYAELVIPIEGPLYITVDGNTESLDVGQAAFVFPFQPHSYYSKVKNNLAMFVFSPSMIPDFFNQTTSKVGVKSVFSPKESTFARF